MPGRVIVKSNKLPLYAATLRAANVEAAKTIADSIISQASSDAPTDTSAMANGFYYVGMGLDTYQEAVERASALRPGVEQVEEIEAPADDHTLRVSNVQPYQPDVELGTARMDARPHFIPAAEGAGAALSEAFKAALDRQPGS